MSNIVIKNLKVEQPTQPYQVKVDRSSVLGNPFVMKNDSEEERELVCWQYEVYFYENIQAKNEVILNELRRLYKLYKTYNKLELFCWCAPKQCHAEIIKKFLEEHLSGKRRLMKMENLSVKDLTVSATGHRPADLPSSYGYDYRNEDWSIIIDNTKALIRDLKATKAISGMALGYDTAFAIAVLQLQKEGYEITLEAAVPCKGQSSRWTAEAKKLYNAILAKCAKVTILSNTYTKECMQDRNEYMVDNSDVVIAMFEHTKTSGGTYNCIKYAKAKKVPVINIYRNLGALIDNINEVKKYLENKPTSTGCEPNVGSLNQMRKEPKIMKETLDLSKLELEKEKYKPMFEWQAIQEEEERQEQFFINEEERRQNATAYELYIKLDPRKGVMDFGLYNNLYNFCIKALKERLVMVLQLEAVFKELLNIEEYTYGFSQNPTCSQMEDLLTALGKSLKILNDPKSREFIKKYKDYDIYTTDEKGIRDYISTYQTILRMLTKCRCGESLEEFKGLINNPKDIYQNDILLNDLEPEYTSFKENEDIEEAEDLVLAY